MVLHFATALLARPSCIQPAKPGRNSLARKINAPTERALTSHTRFGTLTRKLRRLRAIAITSQLDRHSSHCRGSQ